MVSKKKAVAILIIATLGGYAIYKLTQSKASGTPGGISGTCSEYYIKNPDGTYMSLEPITSWPTNLVYMNMVKVYHNGGYLFDTSLYKDPSTNAWYLSFSISGVVNRFHVKPGTCNPG